MNRDGSSHPADARRPRVSAVADRFRSPSPAPRPSRDYRQTKDLPEDRFRDKRDPRSRPPFHERSRPPRDGPRPPPKDDSRGRPPSPRPNFRGRERSPRGRSPPPFSSSATKRRRTRSPLPLPARPKRSKREERNRRRRPERDPPRKSGAPRHPRDFSPRSQRSLSPLYPDDHDRFMDRPGLGDPSERPRPSQSPIQDRSTFDRRPPGPPHPRQDAEFRKRSLSPRPNSRRSSFSRTHSPTGSFARPHPNSSEGGSYQRRVSPHPPPFDPSRSDRIPPSPRDRKSRRGRRKGGGRGEGPFPYGDSATGANSIEVNFSTFSRRVGSGPQASHPHGDRSHHHGIHRERSPSNRSHASSYRTSSRSPASPRARGGRPGPTAPGIGYGPNQSPPHPPTEPASLRGFSRSAFRGGLDSSRDEEEDDVDPKNSQFDAAQVGRATRSPVARSREPSPPRAAVQHELTGTSEPQRLVNKGQLDRSERESDAAPNQNSANEPMPTPTSRPPPSGPANSKFSFAFKPTNKLPSSLPKPEISQKFSSVVKKDSLPQPFDDRIRDLPKDTPREPASSRARTESRADYHQHRQAPEPPPPRTRTVKKIERRIRVKPQLPPNLATSESVFFRKPGNESVVGSGTYGKVFKGVHAYTQRLVALKKIRMEGEKDGFPVTASREIKLLQSLKHTNIVSLQEVMVEHNDCFMVFEYLSHDLTGLLNHPTYQLDLAQKKHLALQLFEGLDYLHKRGVLHRDIKAANILVSSDGVLKLADFGLARFYAKRHNYDYTNRVVTIWYRSPELLLGETQYGAAVDIWSAACVMMEIFTKHAIFPGDGGEISQLEKVYAILGTPNKVDWPGLTDMPWFVLLRPGYRRPNCFAEKYKSRVPEAAFELLEAMFQYDPVKRPNAEQVLAHPYFTTEEPKPRQAVELKDIQGEWHEFESKALRREKEKKEKLEREARKAAAASRDDGGQRDKKRAPPDEGGTSRDLKRPHLDA